MLTGLRSWNLAALSNEIRAAPIVKTQPLRLALGYVRLENAPKFSFTKRCPPDGRATVRQRECPRRFQCTELRIGRANRDV